MKSTVATQIRSGLADAGGGRRARCPDGVPVRRAAAAILGLALAAGGLAMGCRAAVVYFQPTVRHSAQIETRALWDGYDLAERLSDALQD
jgi:hypothetical protein